jgi:competence protein ComEA
VGRFWILLTVVLVAVIAAGSVVIWLRYSPDEPIEITVSEDNDWQGRIYIDGAVNSPGLYPLLDNDTIESLIGAAGGITDNADIDTLKLHIPEKGETGEAQKIDINRAEVWLLEALPGIGETLARRIVDYRRENGPFRSKYDLQKVNGIGASIIEEIADLITVSD